MGQASGLGVHYFRNLLSCTARFGLTLERHPVLPLEACTGVLLLLLFFSTLEPRVE